MRNTAILLTLALTVVSNYGCSVKASEWKSFSDKDNEFTITMPSPVTPVTKDSGLLQYEASDGDTNYTVSLNKRSTLDEKQEIETFAKTFADTYQSGMKKAGYPTERSLEKEVSGSNWKGKLYQFDKPDGSSTTIEVCVEPKHNIILYAFGGKANAPETKSFLDSFAVH
ncbi:hypothetical protein BH11CYA1_BH11CYA1_39880 [soil metagenome]